MTSRVLSSHSSLPFPVTAFIEEIFLYPELLWIYFLKIECFGKAFVIYLKQFVQSNLFFVGNFQFFLFTSLNSSEDKVRMIRSLTFCTYKLLMRLLWLKFSYFLEILEFFCCLFVNKFLFTFSDLFKYPELSLYVIIKLNIYLNSHKP